MKIRTALLLVPVLLAFCVGSAAAKPPTPRSGIDPSFGHGGTIAVSVPKGSAGKPIQMVGGPTGETYVLDDGLLLAFGPDGRPDREFGTNGRLRVTSAAGETTEVTGLAVDGKGRILAAGSVDPTPGSPAVGVPPGGFTLEPVARSSAFVVRYLPDGERDPTFGSAGEIDVTVAPPVETGPTAAYYHFESPVVRADRLAVVGVETPVLGGTYVYDQTYCRSLRMRATGFVGAIDVAGPSPQSIAYAQTPQPDVANFAPMPGGNLAMLSGAANSCDTEGGPTGTTLSTLAYGSPAPAALDPVRPQVSLGSLAVDGWGRFVGVQRHEPNPPEVSTPSSELVRLLPNGDFDTGFGSYGGVRLPKFGDEAVSGLAIDARQRPIVGGGGTRFRFARFGTKGKIDRSFGDHGWLEVGFGRGSKATLAALSIDPEGRIVAVGGVKSSALKTGEGIALTRITTR